MQAKTHFLNIFYTLLAAALLVLGIPNEIYSFGNPLFIFMSVIPFYFAYTKFSSHTEAALLTAFFVMAVHLGSSYWLAFFKDFAIFTLGASAIGTAFIGATIGFFLYSPFSPRSRTLSLVAPSSSLPAFRALWFCVVYTMYEWIKSTGWFGYPWGTLSSGVFCFKVFCQIVDITGTYGLTFLILLFGAVVAEGLILLSRNGVGGGVTSYKSLFALWLALFVAVFIYGVYQYTKPLVPTKSLNTIMVQQNSDPWKHTDDDDAIILSQNLTHQKLIEVRAQGQKVDLVAWSEGCLRHAFPNGELYYASVPYSSPLINFINDCDVPFLIGGSYITSRSPRRIINAAFLFDKKGKFSGVYGKNHLVPCAEVLPFSENLKVRAFWKNTIGISAGWSPGDQYVLFDVPASLPPVPKKLSKTVYLDENGAFEGTVTQSDKPLLKRAPSTTFIDSPDILDDEKPTPAPRVRFSTPICFEDAFPDVCRRLQAYGSELLMNITDDSWSMTKSSEYQHFVIASFRAIEMRTTLARSTNSGYTVVVDPKGRILYDAPLFKEAATFCSIPIFARRETIYLKLGNWLPALCITIVVIIEVLLLLGLYIPRATCVRLINFYTKKRRPVNSRL